MSWITDIGSVANSFAQYDLQKRKINSEANTTTPTQNTKAIDRSINDTATHKSSLYDNKLLIGGGVGLGVLVLVLLLKR